MKNAAGELAEMQRKADLASARAPREDRSSSWNSATEEQSRFRFGGSGGRGARQYQTIKQVEVEVTRLRRERSIPRLRQLELS